MRSVLPWLVLCLVDVSALVLQKGLPPDNARRCLSAYADELDKVYSGMGDHLRSHPLSPARVSRRPLVIVASPGSAATTSLSAALDSIGLWNGHDSGLLLTDLVLAGPIDLKYCPDREWTADEVQSCLNTIRSHDYPQGIGQRWVTMDTPTSELFLDLFLAFPNARVIYSTRPGESWLKSRKRIGSSLLPVQEPCGWMMMPRKPMNFTDEEIIATHDLNEKFVKCMVPPEHLLEFNLWTDSTERVEGLVSELASFVGKADPHVPFPRLDTSADLGEALGVFEFERLLIKSRKAC